MSYDILAYTMSCVNEVVVQPNQLIYDGGLCGKKIPYLGFNPRTFGIPFSRVSLAVSLDILEQSYMIFNGFFGNSAFTFKVYCKIPYNSCTP